MSASQLWHLTHCKSYRGSIPGNPTYSGSVSQSPSLYHLQCSSSSLLARAPNSSYYLWIPCHFYDFRWLISNVCFYSMHVQGVPWVAHTSTYPKILWKLSGNQSTVAKMSLSSIVVSRSICSSDSKQLKYLLLAVTPKLLARLYAKKKNWLVLTWCKSCLLRILNADKTFFLL